MNIPKNLAPDLKKRMDRILSGDVKVRSRILRVGVELEGLWMKLPPGVRECVHDGSVYRGMNLPPDVVGRGEINSPPLPPAKVGGWMEIHYPHYNNETCGMHVHMSVRYPDTYARLVVPEYSTAMVHYIKEWASQKPELDKHYIWGRLKGQNQFCQHTFTPDLQIKARDKRNHYSLINYCYALHSTVECRLLPMFPTAKLAEEAVGIVLKVTNAFLVATKSNNGKKRLAAAVGLIDDEPTNIVRNITI